MKTSKHIALMHTELLDWYGREARRLPWRIRPEDRAKGIVPEPYKIWLSEIMCQQTTTRTAQSYWHKFLHTWPSVQDLAQAERAQVLAAWAGLGYYARARNLHLCAKLICSDYDGVFPRTEAELQKLPGIGPYSAAAIAAICFDAPTNIVDGNVERVMARIFCVDAPLPKAKPVLRTLAAGLAHKTRPGDYGQALMDLGAHVCKPKTPKCTLCPWQDFCLAHQTGTQGQYPKRVPKRQRPVRFGAVFFVRGGAHILVQTRADKGLLGGMLELPGTDWTDETPEVQTWMTQAPFTAEWRRLEGEIKHVFTHFTLVLQIFTAEMPSKKNAQKNWKMADLDRLDTYALPSLMRKAITHALANTHS